MSWVNLSYVLFLFLKLVPFPCPKLPKNVSPAGHVPDASRTCPQNVPVLTIWGHLQIGRVQLSFQQVTHKGKESAINYIKKFQNAHALSVSVGNSYSGYQLMHTFLDNFHQGGKYSAQIASPEWRREEKFTDQKSLNISSLQTDYLNIDSSSSGSSRNSERAHSVQKKYKFCGGNNNYAEKCFKKIRKEKEKARAVDVSSKS